MLTSTYNPPPVSNCESAATCGLAECYDFSTTGDWTDYDIYYGSSTRSLSATVEPKFSACQSAFTVYPEPPHSPFAANVQYSSSTTTDGTVTVDITVDPTTGLVDQAGVPNTEDDYFRVWIRVYG